MTYDLSPVTYYYHFDSLGSVVALSDSSRNVVEKYSYDVFGAVTIRDANNSVVSVSSVANPYMFTGRQYDSETGNYYYRARYYKPDIGRFLQTDPMGYEDSMNLYTYVRNNPINHVDPSGLGSCGALLWGIIKVFYYNNIGDDKGVTNDKFAHCYISCRLTQECGHILSTALGWLKELRKIGDVYLFFSC